MTRLISCSTLLVSLLAAAINAESPDWRLSETTAPESRGGGQTTVFDITGRWVLTLPAGWQRRITIARASKDTYLLRGETKLVWNGIYELDPDCRQLSLIEANDPSERKYVWQVLNANTLQLIEQETGGGGDYLGATLSRHFDWDRLKDGESIPMVGVLSHASPVEIQSDAN